MDVERELRISIINKTVSVLHSGKLDPNLGPTGFFWHHNLLLSLSGFTWATMAAAEWK
jgi:hypothetical protein